MSEALTETEWWQEHGYLAGKPTSAPGVWVCVAPMVYTFRLMICDEESVYEFWCYPHDRLDDVLDAFDRWDGDGEPLAGWTRHHV